MLVRLFRKGTFGLIAKNVPSRCGDIRPSVCGYECQITVDERDLDSLGFVCRQRVIAAYFAQAYGKKPTGDSCEMMAVKAARHFIAMFARKQKSISVSVRIRIYPSNDMDRYAEAIE